MSLTLYHDVKCIRISEGGVLLPPMEYCHGFPSCEAEYSLGSVS